MHWARKKITSLQSTSKASNEKWGNSIFLAVSEISIRLKGSQVKLPPQVCIPYLQVGRCHPFSQRAPAIWAPSALFLFLISALCDQKQELQCSHYGTWESPTAYDYWGSLRQDIQSQINRAPPLQGRVEYDPCLTSTLFSNLQCLHSIIRH